MSLPGGHLKPFELGQAIDKLLGIDPQLAVLGDAEEFEKASHRPDGPNGVRFDEAALLSVVLEL